jgi:hypothetical protein
MSKDDCTLDRKTVYEAFESYLTSKQIKKQWNSSFISSLKINSFLLPLTLAFKISSNYFNKISFLSSNSGKPKYIISSHLS